MTCQQDFSFCSRNGAAAHIESRTAAECEDHYRHFYINGIIGDGMKKNTMSFVLLNVEIFINSRPVLLSVQTSGLSQ